MIRYSEVTFEYPAGMGAVLRDVELAVEDGAFTVVAGPSGSGKSTLLRAANGLVPHSTGGRFAGTVTAYGRSTREHRPRDMADVVGFVHQDPEAQFVVDNVEADVAFVLENLGTHPDTTRRRVEEVLDALDLTHLRSRSPATLSGGEKQRVAIAGALAAAPRALVLDEPTSQLDPQGAEDVLGALVRLNADLGTTIVLAEHRLDRSAPPSDCVVLMAEGRVVANGPPADVLAGYEGAPAVTRLGKLLGWSPLPLTVKQARRFPRPEWVDESVPSAPEAAAPGEVLLRARALAVDLGGRRVLEGADVELRRGEIVALLGRNGAGKTTLLRALAGLQSRSHGTVESSGRVAYVPQDPNSLLFSTSVREELAETQRLLGHPRDETIDRWIEALRLEAVAGRHPRTLSGGERQRVAVAAVGVGGAEVLLLDEPTRGMDPASRRALQAMLEDHAGRGGAVVLATHDIELAARCATRALVVGDGSIIADGEARGVLAGSLFAPQVLRVLPPYLTVEEVDGVRRRERRG